VIPDHQLLRRIGYGSYGEIWLAKNILGTYRAVKIVYRVQFDTERPYEREFKGIQESEPISRSHPGLVDILQIGRNDEAGYFYYVMELADDETGGSSFHPDRYSAKTLSKELAARDRLPAAESLLLGQNLAAALAHMHQHGLVHRDIKPSNIIFVSGEPKLADIGLVALVTAAHTYVGTEGYIPPEGPGSIQADIYSLGKVLYEASTGEDRQLFPQLPGDLPHFPDAELVTELQEVVVKACAPLPTARYASADDFRSDLQMLAAGRSVKRLRFVEQQLRRVKRLAIVASVLAIAAIIFGSIVTALRARERRLIAHNYLTGSTRLMEEGNLHGALPLLAGALQLQKGDSSTLETHRTRIGTVLQQSPKLLQFWQTESGLLDAHFSPNSQQLLLAGGKRAWLADIQTGATGLVFLAEQPIQTAAFRPDGQRVVLAHGHFLSVREVSTGSNCSNIRMHTVVNAAEFSPDGEMILAACRGNCAHLFNAVDGKMDGAALRGHTGLLMHAGFSADGSRIVTAAQDGTARIWDVKTRQTLRILQHAEPNYRVRKPPWVLSAAFSPDGRRVVTTSSDRSLRVWNVNDGSVSLPPMEHRGGVRRARFSPDGRYIVSAGYDQMVRVWDAFTGQSTSATINLRSSAMQAEFDADACRVVTAGFGGEVKVWHVVPPAPVFAGPGIVSGNGERYVTFSSNTFQRWNARNDSPIGSAEVAPDAILRALCDSKGDRVVIQTADLDNDSRLGHVFDGEARRTNSFSAPGPGRWWLNDTGTKLITATEHEIFLWEVESGTLRWQSVNSPVAISRAVFSPDEGTIAVAAEKTVFLLEGRTGKLSAKPLALEQNVRALAFSHDSSQLVTATSGSGFSPGAAQLWHVRTGQRIGSAMSHADGLSDARFSHDGHLVATAGEDNRARVWNAMSGAPVAEPISLLSPVLSAEFSADDRWLITATWFGVQIWDTRTGHAVSPPFTDVSILKRAGFCDGGQRIWAESLRGLVFWDLPRHPGEPDELIALANYLGVTVPSSVQWNRDAFTSAKLHERCAAERARLQANLDSWQREQATLSEALSDWFAAQFYLRRLLQRVPGDETLQTRLRKAQAELETSLAPLPLITREPSR
jgi:WD40 repeat protein/serine/threonine protein kinase